MSEQRVLIVDDEKEFASTLAERLNLRDMDATAVYCAEDALALIHTVDHVPDVVLLDLKMPNIDGLQALEAIKQYDPSIEVIMLTGHGDKKVRRSQRHDPRLHHQARRPERTRKKDPRSDRKKAGDPCPHRPRENVT